MGSGAEWGLGPQLSYQGSIASISPVIGSIGCGFREGLSISAFRSHQIGCTAVPCQFTEGQGPQGAAPRLPEKLTALWRFLMWPPPPFPAGDAVRLPSMSCILRHQEVSVGDLSPDLESLSAEAVSELLSWPPHSTTSLLLFWSETEMIPLSSRNSPRPHCLVQGGKVAQISRARAGRAGTGEKMLSSHITGSGTLECHRIPTTSDL